MVDPGVGFVVERRPADEEVHSGVEPGLDGSGSKVAVIRIPAMNMDGVSAK